MHAVGSGDLDAVNRFMNAGCRVPWDVLEAFRAHKLSDGYKWHMDTDECAARHKTAKVKGIEDETDTPIKCAACNELVPRAYLGRHLIERHMRRA